ncbi:hypothetical protein QVD17_37387 [Tagetes erecta]|uniref:Uncharacterized protein n=1 Tax=Tagetes erecta TaxID=13708 RepID=A0AAD8JY51_TARER|nr:hypothetical protein QVD17_37387 [Tagetes erecta]
MFLSLTATSPAIAKFVKTGCNDTCGNNVTIPYPFGIGAGCSINQWYAVDCKSSKPYLSALKHLEVFSIDLDDQKVTVYTPKIPNCRNPVLNSSEIMGVDLGNSPFFFSKLHNTFVFKGCGFAVMMDNERVVTGCSTACLNVTLNDTNNCVGNGCCQIEIPYYLKSYSIHIERQGEDGDCESAFLVDVTKLNDEGWYFDPFNHVIRIMNKSLVPISLKWTLTDSDHVTCCERDPITRKVDMFNSTPLVTRYCGYSSLSNNPYVIDGCREDGK